ncbi:hypothetical protein NHQ30_008014 [Ciborinia camelliae]|nr:hypothetical protein NHQ30_008014 [Ciborinia camelliae]
METGHEKSASTRPFVDLKALMETGHQLDIQQIRRNYKMRSEDDYDPTTRSKMPEVIIIGEPEDKKMPSEVPSEPEEIQEEAEETRADVKRRRRQELLDNYDAEPLGPSVDRFLESQIVHFVVLQQCGLAPFQDKAQVKARQRDYERNRDSEDSGSAPRFGDSHANSSMRKYSVRKKKAGSSRGGKDMSPLGKCGSGIAKKGHVAKKRAVINEKDKMELMFKGIHNLSKPEFTEATVVHEISG